MIIRTPPKITNKNSFLKYIEVDLWSWLRDLTTGLLKLNFQQNFQSFTATDITIPPGTEVAIPNQFRLSYHGSIPTSRIIVRQKGDANIVDGPTPWNEALVYLLNPSANKVTITVIFFI